MTAIFFLFFFVSLSIFVRGVVESVRVSVCASVSKDYWSSN